MDRKTKILLMVGIGAAVGAATAIFLQTEKGKQLFDEAVDLAGDVEDKILDQLAQLKDKVTQVKEKSEGYVRNKAAAPVSDAI
jgi:gas vesicle protein